MITVRIKTKSAELLPEKGRDGDAGFDLRAAAEATLAPGERAAIGTGVKMAIPAGMFGLVKDRSGLAHREGLHVLAGVIDSNYRGEVKVVLVNLGRKECRLEKGERIAQVIFLSCPETRLTRTSNLDRTDRDENGFGSSGR